MHIYILHICAHISVAFEALAMEDYQISRAEGPIASFQKHFASLASSQEFSDVTLVCKDLKPVALHRVILSSSSLWFRELLPKLPDKPTIYLDNIDPLALAPLLAFIYKGEAKVAKTLLSSFMEAANILMIDGLSDKDKIENMLEEKKEDDTEPPGEQSEMLEDANPLETKLEEDYLSCSICGFATFAKSKSNQIAVMNQHNRKVHGNGEQADIRADGCQTCGFQSLAKSEKNRKQLLKRHMLMAHQSKSGEIIFP